MAHRLERWKEFDDDELMILKDALETEILFAGRIASPKVEIEKINKLHDDLEEYMASIAVADGPDILDVERSHAGA